MPTNFYLCAVSLFLTLISHNSRFRRRRYGSAATASTDHRSEQGRSARRGTLLLLGRVLASVHMRDGKTGVGVNLVGRGLTTTPTPRNAIPKWSAPAPRQIPSATSMVSVYSSVRALVACPTPMSWGTCVRCRRTASAHVAAASRCANFTCRDGRQQASAPKPTDLSNTFEQVCPLVNEILHRWRRLIGHAALTRNCTCACSVPTPKPSRCARSDGAASASDKLGNSGRAVLGLILGNAPV